MFRSTDIAHTLIRQRLHPGDWAVDATLGNGHDALFLSQLVGPEGHVFGFDPQEAAHEATKSCFISHDHPLDNLTLFLAGHETMGERLVGVETSRIRCVMFNLGYLPGGDKQFTTATNTTLAALESATRLLPDGGLISVVVYPGHPGGAEEGQAVVSFLTNLPRPWKTYSYQCLNSKMPAPYLVMSVKG